MRITVAQGSPQWIVIGFPGPVDVAEVRIMFQGGFVGQVLPSFLLQATHSLTHPKGVPVPCLGGGTGRWFLHLPLPLLSGGDQLHPDILSMPHFMLCSCVSSRNAFFLHSLSLHVFQCQAKGVRQLKILFGASTDFYGRVTIYQLDVLGESR